MVNQATAERVATDDVYMLLGQMFHIPVVLAMNYLAHGRPVVLMNFEPRQTLEVIEAERVSGFLGITTMVNCMMDVPGFDRFDLSSLRLVKYGGGPMAQTTVRRCMEAFPCDLMQGYGQTEGVHVLLPAALGPPARSRRGSAPTARGAAGRSRTSRRCASWTRTASRCHATARRWGRSSSAARR